MAQISAICRLNYQRPANPRLLFRKSSDSPHKTLAHMRDVAHLFAGSFLKKSQNS